MKYTIPFTAFLIAIAAISSVRAESPNERDFKQLKDQREKDLATAAEPINRRYAKSLEQLIKRTSDAGQVELAVEIKKELRSVIPAAMPAALLGRWHFIYSKSDAGDYTINADGTAVFPNGLTGNCATEGDYMVIRWKNGYVHRIPGSQSGSKIRGEWKQTDNAEKWTPMTATR